MKQAMYFGTLLTALAVAAEPVAVTVNYVNQANVPLRILRTSMNEAEFLFSKAGIRIKWVDCTSFEGKAEVPPYCLHSNPTQFRITFRNAVNTKAVTLGFAYPTVGARNRAAVVYPHVIEFAARYADISALELVLGAVITHELGHLFFGTNEHGDGIMLPEWEKAHIKQMGQRRLQFSPVQTEIMRAALAARQNPQLWAKR